MIAAVISAFLCVSIQPGPLADRPLRDEAVVDANIAEVWAAWATEPGIESWLARDAVIELKPGGRYATNGFGAVGEPGTAELTVLAFDPGRMLAFTTSAPPDEFPEVAAAEGTWAVVSLYPVDDGHTRVVYTMLGWGSGPEWQPAHMFFEAALARQVRDLGKVLGRRPVPEHTEGAEPVRGGVVIDRMLSAWTGAWEADVVDPDGVPTVVRNTIQPGPGGHGLTISGSFLTRDGSRLHASTLVWLNPGGDATRFLCLQESGDLAQGEITLVGDALSWNWRSTDPNGREQSFRVVMTPDGPDAYRLRMLDDKSGQPVLEARFSRVADPVPPGGGGDEGG